MNQRLKVCMEGTYENNIAPFFWQHGDSHEALASMIDIIRSAHMDAFCVESRVHEEFGREKWWDDFGYILEEAKKRDMKVWLLDDKYFPSGFANGYLMDHPELIRRMIREQHVDVVGPQKQISLLSNHCKEGEELLYVLAYNRAEDGAIIPETCLELTDRIHDGLLLWDVPQGYWRVFYLIETTAVIAATDDSKYYIDMMSEASCHAMIDAVYEPHYKHFSAYFGNTFLGFFSDEPCLSNEKGTYGSVLGKKEVPLPWNRELIRMMADRSAVSEWEVISRLPGLWHDMASDTDVVRYFYMDAVSERYRRCFSRQLGDWCCDHGVRYIGHVIEDMNTHMRLGYGCSHFFRAMDGQDMAGADVVLHQIVPGFSDMTHHAMIADHGVADPEFFDYTLAKLAASASHLDPKKRNRCMCEVFGAYGWAEGLPMMKYLADHMIVNGVNYFIPHAFTTHYPNADCPPHFWANGRNPQFAYFGSLMDYMNRCVHLLSDGRHCADVAVYYNAEGEWCAGEHMLFQRIAKLLTQNQIDFDIVPFDSLRDFATVLDGHLCINEESYGALLVSYSERLPYEVMKTFGELAEQGLSIIFADGLPETTVGSQKGEEMGQIKTEQLVSVVLNEISTYLENAGKKSFFVKESCSHLRFYHVKQKNADTIMLYNDSIFQDVDTEVKLPFAGDLIWYDPWSGELWKEQTKDGWVRLQLARYSTLFIMSEAGRMPENSIRQKKCFEQIAYKPELTYDIYIREPGGEERLYATKSTLINLSSPEHLPHFCGTIRYVTTFEAEEKDVYIGIDLGLVGETAEVVINGHNCGLRVQQPYRFSIENAIKQGENRLEVLVTNNPAYRERDDFSRMLALPPSGLLGDVVLYREK